MEEAESRFCDSSRRRTNPKLAGVVEEGTKLCRVKRYKSAIPLFRSQKTEH